MKYTLLTVAALVLFCSVSFSQLTFSPSGGNKKAMVGENIGLTDITIHYSRPHVNGREGKIWGNLIPVGYSDQGFGSSKAAPWRAGANESTTIEFSSDVKVEGQPLAAGKYGFFIAYDPNECTLIFSKNNTSWGSFYYDPNEDVLRVKVKPVVVDKSQEWLAYEFSDQTDHTSTINVVWEKLRIPFKVEVDVLNQQLESLRHELRTNKGFNWNAWDQAAQYCVQHNANLDQALLWSDSATSTTFGGDHIFQPWSTKASILNKMGKNAEADAAIKKALPYANMNELHQYGRSLIAQKRPKDALDIFKMNFDKNPNQFTTLMGLTRGYSANGDYKTALKYAQQALPMSPPGANKSNVENMVKLLQDGKDVN